jgi:hypothetical protein
VFTWSVPKEIEWSKASPDISIHIDYGVIKTPDKSKINYAWLSEPKTVNCIATNGVFNVKDIDN